jgi:hypothetical protein
MSGGRLAGAVGRWVWVWVWADVLSLRRVVEKHRMQERVARARAMVVVVVVVVTDAEYMEVAHVNSPCVVAAPHYISRRHDEILHSTLQVQQQYCLHLPM